MLTMVCGMGFILASASAADSNCIHVSSSDPHFYNITEGEVITVECTLRTTSCNTTNTFDIHWYLMSPYKQNIFDIDQIHHLPEGHPYKTITHEKTGFSLVIHRLRAILRYVVLQCAAKENGSTAPEVRAREPFMIEILPQLGTTNDSTENPSKTEPMEPATSNPSKTESTKSKPSPMSEIPKSDVGGQVNNCTGDTEVQGMNREKVAILVMVPGLAVNVVTLLLVIILLLQILRKRDRHQCDKCETDPEQEMDTTARMRPREPSTSSMNEKLLTRSCSLK